MTARFPELSAPGRLMAWAAELVQALNRESRNQEQTLVRQGGLFVAVEYTVATLPSASTYRRGIVFVSDEAGGPVLAFSDGTDWRRVTDRAVVS